MHNINQLVWIIFLYSLKCIFHNFVNFFIHCIFMYLTYTARPLIFEETRDERSVKCFGVYRLA